MQRLSRDLDKTDLAPVSFCTAINSEPFPSDGIKVSLSNILHLDFEGHNRLEFTMTNGRVIELVSEDILGVLNNIVVTQNPNQEGQAPVGEHTAEPSMGCPKKDQVGEMKEGAVVAGSLIMIPASFKCDWKGKLVPLTAGEFSLLLALAKRPGDVKSRAQLIDEAFGHDYAGYDRAIDSYMKRIRLKFKALDPRFAQIETLYGVGYRYMTD